MLLILKTPFTIQEFFQASTLTASSIYKDILWIGNPPQSATRIRVELDLSCHSDILIDTVKMAIQTYQLHPEFVYYQRQCVPLLDAQLLAWQQKHGLEDYPITICEEDKTPVEQIEIIAKLVNKDKLEDYLTGKKANHAWMLLPY